MNNKQAWILGTMLLLVVGLLAWSIFSKDNDLKQAVSDLKAARAEIESARKNLDKSLKVTETIINGNNNFQGYVHSVDSITKRRDLEAQKREQRFIATVDKVNKSIEKLKADLAKSDSRLPEIPVGNLTEE